jgi:hypothetical protein
MKAPGYSPTLTSLSARSHAAPRYIANFDSALAMLRSLGRYLRGKDFPCLGMLPPLAAPLAQVVNSLPPGIKDFLYTWGGWAEAVPPEKLGQVQRRRRCPSGWSQSTPAQCIRQ